MSKSEPSCGFIKDGQYKRQDLVDLMSKPVRLFHLGSVSQQR